MKIDRAVAMRSKIDKEKYRLAVEFEPLRHVKLPLIKPLTIPVQAVMRMFPCMPTEEVRVKRIEIDGSDGNKIPTLVIEPRCRSGEKMPCLVYYHGGGFIFPAAPYHFELAKRYALDSNCVVIFPDYRLAPGYRFPAAPEDCYSAYVWTVNHSEELHIYTDRIAVGGDSAGGNLAAVVPLMARDRNQKMPCFQMLIYPVTDRRMQTPSSLEYYDAPVWNTNSSRKMWEFYLLEKHTEPLEYYSTVESRDLTGLPDAYIEVAEFDSLRDEGLEYAAKLSDAGCKVTMHQTYGAPHGFELITKNPIVEDSIRRRCEILRTAFRNDQCFNIPNQI